MPDIFRYFGFTFYFYSREHNPIHVHVEHDNHESVFELIVSDGQLVEIRVREARGKEPLNSRDEKTAREFVQEYSQNIIRKWINFFVMNKRVTCTTIKKRLK